LKENIRRQERERRALRIKIIAN